MSSALAGSEAQRAGRLLLLWLTVLPGAGSQEKPGPQGLSLQGGWDGFPARREDQECVLRVGLGWKKGWGGIPSLENQILWFDSFCLRCGSYKRAVSPPGSEGRQSWVLAQV